MATGRFTEAEQDLAKTAGVYRDFLGRPMVTNEVKENVGKFADYQTTYDTYAGTDITATILLPWMDEKPLTLGELHTLSYSMHRENTPVRTLGRTNACGFVKGPRTIAGHLVFTQFNKYVWYRLERFRHMVLNGLYPLADMLPPFDIVISMQNESGSFSKLKILGCTVISEGSAMSVDDLMIEQDYTFMARGIMPMVSYVPEGFEVLTTWNPEGGGVRTAGNIDGIGMR